LNFEFFDVERLGIWKLTIFLKVVEGEVKFENDEHKNQYEGLPDEVSFKIFCQPIIVPEIPFVFYRFGMARTRIN
jgi:hypothetical protein